MNGHRVQSPTRHRAGGRNEVLGMATELVWAGVLIVVGYLVSQLFFIGR